MCPDLMQSNGHNQFCISKGTDIYLYFLRDDYSDESIWFGPKDGSDAEYYFILFNY